MSRVQDRQKSTARRIAAIAKPTNAPIQIPIARRSHSRRHSGHPATARAVARRAANLPTAIQTTALEATAMIHLVPPLTTGKPRIGRVGHEMTERAKPIAPRSVDCDPHNMIVLMRPLNAMGIRAATGPNMEMAWALWSIPSGTRALAGAAGRGGALRCGAERGEAEDFDVADCELADFELADVEFGDFDIGGVERGGLGAGTPAPGRDRLVRDIGSNLVAPDDAS